MAHDPMCAMVMDRRMLTANIRRACKAREISEVHDALYLEGDDGSFEQLAHWYGVLTGIVAEYSPGGDQELENCTCGEVQRRQSA